MKKITTLFCVTFLSFTLKTQAQDLHFSQSQLVPLTINPALAGSACGARLIDTYRF